MARRPPGVSGISLRSFARRVGVTHNSIRAAIQSGRLSTNPDGTIDPERGEVEWTANRRSSPPTARPGSTRPVTSAVSEQYHGARAVRETFEARFAELRYKVRAGELISSKEVKVAAFEEARRARDLLKNLGVRVGPIVAGLAGDAAACIRVIDEEVSRVIAEISAPPPPTE